MGFENFEPNAFEEQDKEEERGDTEEEINSQELSGETPIETEEDAPESKEKTEEQFFEESWPSPEEIKEEKTAPSLGKSAIAAAVVLAGTLATGTQAYAGAPEQFAADQKDEITISHENEASSQEMESKKSELYNRMLGRFRETLQKKNDFSGIKNMQLRRSKEERVAREHAWMQTVIDHPEKVHTTIDTEKETVFFVGTYTDPVSGAEQPFEQIYRLIKK